MSSIFSGKPIKLRCPKCKSSTFELTEVIEEMVIYEVVEGIMPDHATDHEPGGSISLWCSCNCGHKWKPRATSLSSVVEE